MFRVRPEAGRWWLWPLPNASSPLSARLRAGSISAPPVEILGLAVGRRCGLDRQGSCLKSLDVALPEGGGGWEVLSQGWCFTSVLVKSCFECEYLCACHVASLFLVQVMQSEPASKTRMLGDIPPSAPQSQYVQSGGRHQAPEHPHAQPSSWAPDGHWQCRLCMVMAVNAAMAAPAAVAGIVAAGVAAGGTAGEYAVSRWNRCCRSRLRLFRGPRKSHR